jgi:hypothetical protein
VENTETFDQDKFERAFKESIEVGDSRELPDIEIPEAKLSYRTIGDFIEGLLKFKPRHISGEVTILTPKPTFGPSDPHGEQLSITIRVTSMEKGDPRESRVSVLSAFDPKDAIRESAKAVLQLIEPADVAMYEYIVEKNPHTAWYLTTQCYGDWAKWGWLLQGIIQIDQGDLNGAASKFKQAVNLDPKNVRCH